MKKIFCILIFLLYACNIFASVVVDYDGMTFVTKKEFEDLKQNFNKQIYDYQNSIDNKIEGFIAEYLAGLAKKEGVFTPNIRDLDNVEWRDILVRVGAARRWTTATTYESNNNYVWKATYDTILKAGISSNPSAVNQKCQLLWAVNGSQGHGGCVLTMYGLFDGGDYWKAQKWGARANAYDCPNMPMIRYHKNKYASTVEQQQKMYGWFDYGTNFANAVSQLCDNTTAPDGTTCSMNNGYRSISTLFSRKYAMDAGAGRDTNAFGIRFETSATGTTSTQGFRPIKSSTIIFPWQLNTNNGRNRDGVNCSGYSTVPTSTWYPCVTLDEDRGDVTNDSVHCMLLGDTNTQEVNYLISREDVSFWDTRVEWPEDCYKDFVLTDIVLRRMPINQYPGPAPGTTGDDSWPNADNKRQEDTITVTPDTYKYAWSCESAPASLNISLPTKPHKPLKELDSNFISEDGSRYIKFGEGLCITDRAPASGIATISFDVETNPEFVANGCTATIELCNKNFNDNSGATYYTNISGATRLSSTSNKYVINTTARNTIVFDIKEKDKIYVRFSPNDKSKSSAGLNFVKIKNLQAKYSKG